MEVINQTEKEITDFEDHEKATGLNLLNFLSVKF